MDVDSERGFYQMYLGGLCNRRAWPKPAYSPYQPSPSDPTSGWSCVVRVNNREYRTDVTYARKDLAQESAATRAYMICRNFSANDGMYPGQRLAAGAQGMPVAIGAGRKVGGAAGGKTGGGNGGGGGGARAAARMDGSGGGASCGRGLVYMQQNMDERVAPAYACGKHQRHGCECDEASTLSGGESPRSIDSAVAFGAQQQVHQQKSVPKGGVGRTMAAPAQCRCRRGLSVLRHERCWMCLREVGWIV